MIEQKDDEQDALVGNFIEERCPKCGSHLLANKRGDKWCSFIGGVSVAACDYGLESASPKRGSQACSQSAASPGSLRREKTPEAWWAEHMTMLCTLAQKGGVASFRAWKEGTKWCFEVTPEASENGGFNCRDPKTSTDKENLMATTETVTRGTARGQVQAVVRSGSFKDPGAWASYNDPSGVHVVLCCVCRHVFKFPQVHDCDENRANLLRWQIEGLTGRAASNDAISRGGEAHHE